MKRLIILFILVTAVFPLSVSADDPSPDDFYRQQYEISGADKLDDALPDSTREYFRENSLDPSDYKWVNALTTENVFRHIINFITSGAKAPLAAGAGILAVILISAAISSTGNKSGSMSAALYASALASAAIIAVPVFSAVTASVNAMQGIGTFMLAFIPVFAAVITASGAVMTSISASALLLGATQAVSYISNFAVLPLMGGYLAISISSSVSPLVQQSGIASGIKKISFWIMSFVSTVFVGILSVQTAVNSSADGLTVKTAKFILGSAIPVAGTALSEAFSTVTASMGVLKSSVGIYGVIACCAIILPLIVELLLWRVMLMLSSFAAEIFSLPKISGLLKAVDMMMSVLVGIMLLTGAMFIISLTLVVSTGKA